MTEDKYWFWLCNIDSLGLSSMGRLFDKIGGPEDIYKAAPEALKEKALLSDAQVKDVYSSRNEKDINEIFDKFREGGGRFFYRDGPGFPQRLKLLEDCPYGLFVKGNLPEDDKPAAGMVGARACSRYGREMTLLFAGELARANVNVISGLAHGIDAASARGALDKGGKTFAVLGSGIDIIYPMENIELYYEIILKGGGIISEYPLGAKPLNWRFPQRNRLISGLSDILLIMEARKHSGTLITASYALSQGKDVYALPGRIDDPLSEGCNRMIADGAGMLLSPEYLLAEFPGGKRKAQENEEHLFNESEEALRDIYLLLDYNGTDLNEIIRLSGMDAADAMAALTELELSGLAEEISGGIYAKAR